MMLQQRNCCRLCLNTCNNHRSLYDEAGKANETYELMRKYFTPAMLNMEWEKKLVQMCVECWNHINEFHLFQESVIKAQKTNRINVTKGQQIDNEDQRTYLSFGEVQVKTEIETSTMDQLIEVAPNSVGRSGAQLESVTSGFNIKTENCDEIVRDDDLDDFGHQIENYEEVPSDLLKGILKLENDLSDALTDQRSGEVTFAISMIEEEMETTTEQTPESYNNAQPTLEELDDLILLWRPNLECEICNASSGRYTLLIEHFRQHHPSEACHISCCSLKLSHRYEILKHIRYHQTPKNLRCDECFEVFTRKYTLTCHKMQMHSVTPVSFECPNCPASFKTALSLKRHMSGNCHGIRNEGEGNEFSCKECHRSYKSIHSLKRHFDMIHGKKSSLAHKCNVCGRIFKYSADIRKHMRTKHPNEMNEKGLEYLEEEIEDPRRHIEYSPLNVEEESTMEKAKEDDRSLRTKQPNKKAMEYLEEEVEDPRRCMEYSPLNVEDDLSGKAKEYNRSKLRKHPNKKAMEYLEEEIEDPRRCMEYSPLNVEEESKMEKAKEDDRSILRKHPNEEALEYLEEEIEDPRRHIEYSPLNIEDDSSGMVKKYDRSMISLEAKSEASFEEGFRGFENVSMADDDEENEKSLTSYGIWDTKEWQMDETVDSHGCPEGDELSLAISRNPLKSPIGDSPNLDHKHLAEKIKDLQPKSHEDFDYLIAQWRPSLECLICGETFSIFSRLDKHFIEQHPSDECHLLCCELKLRHRYEIEKHIRYHCAPEDARCHICFKVYQLESSVKDHMEKLHGVKPRRKCKKIKYKDEGELACNKCERSFKSYNSLRQHQYHFHTKKAPRQQHKCSICDKCFNTVCRLREHEAMHKGEAIYACSHCSRKFVYQTDIIRHMKKYHVLEWEKRVMDRKRTREVNRENFRYQCTLCTKAYSMRQSVRVHIKRIHKKEPLTVPIRIVHKKEIASEPSEHKVKKRERKDFACGKCQKSYKTYNSLRQHKCLSHTRKKSKPYNCSICDKNFKSIGLLKDHEAMHKGLRMHKCQYCPKEFIYRTDVSRHIRKHHRQACNGRKQEKEHERKNLFYGCSLCSKVYRLKQTLKVHIKRKHENETQYLAIRRDESASSFIVEDEDGGVGDVDSHQVHEDPLADCDAEDSSLLETLHESIITTDDAGNRNVDEFPRTTRRKTFVYKPKSSEEFDDLVSKWRSHLECLICHQREFLRYSQLLDHYSQQHAGEDCYLECCQLKLQGRFNIEHHINYHNASPEEKCNICCKVFATISNCRTHMRKMHGKTFKKVKNERPRYKTRNTSNDIKPKHELDEMIAEWIPNLKCSICSELFPNYSLMLQHQTLKHPLQECYISCCHQKLKNNYEIERHIQYHKASAEEKCTICYKVFPSPVYLKEHMTRKHSGQLKSHKKSNHIHYCAICKKFFKTKLSLKSHQFLYHSRKLKTEHASTFSHKNIESVTIHSCSYCPETFKNKIELDCHLTQYHGEEANSENSKMLAKEENQNKFKIRLKGIPKIKLQIQKPNKDDEAM